MHGQLNVPAAMQGTYDARRRALRTKVELTVSTRGAEPEVSATMRAAIPDAQDADCLRARFEGCIHQGDPIA